MRGKPGRPESGDAWGVAILLALLGLSLLAVRGLLWLDRKWPTFWEDHPALLVGGIVLMLLCQAWLGPSQMLDLVGTWRYLRTRPAERKTSFPAPGERWPASFVGDWGPDTARGRMLMGCPLVLLLVLVMTVGSLVAWGAAFAGQSSHAGLIVAGLVAFSVVAIYVHRLAVRGLRVDLTREAPPEGKGTQE